MEQENENAPGAEHTAQGQERTFTQAEVDALITQRLARERKKYPSAEEMAAFAAWQRAGRVRFTNRVGTDGDESMTREQIMAIPDRAGRRAAIAKHIDLF